MRLIAAILILITVGSWSQGYALDVVPQVYANHPEDTKDADKKKPDDKTDKDPEKDPYSNLPNQAIINPLKDAQKSVWSDKKFDTSTFTASTFPGTKDIPIKENSQFSKTLNYQNLKLGEQKWGGGVDKKAPFDQTSDFSGKESQFDTKTSSTWQSRTFPTKNLTTLQAQTSTFNSQPLSSDSSKMYDGPLTGKDSKALENHPLSEFFAGKLKDKDGQILSMDEVKKLLNEK